MSRFVGLVMAGSEANKVACTSLGTRNGGKRFSVAGPVMGSLKQHYGWEGLFLGAASMCLVSAVSWLFIDCTRRLVAD